MIRNRNKISRGMKVLLGAALLACCSSVSVAADTISGVVRNGTRGKPAAGDEVVLLRLGQDPREEARAKTDSQGAFTLQLQEPDKPHLVRVIHQGVNYDRQASTGAAIPIDVFDATAKAQGIAGSIEIIRSGSHGNQLHVSDMIEIKNESNPPVTQAGNRTFEVFLPADATISSVLAAGPEGAALTISALPVSGEPGHYAVNFPLRPGATKFAFNYDVPYSGRATFRTRSMYPVQQLAVMIPPTMKFTSRSAAFQVLPVGSDRYQVEAAEQVKAGKGPEFEISGVGALPPLQGSVHASAKPAAGTVAAPPAQGRSGTQAQAAIALAQAPSSKPSAGSQLLWWALGACAALVLGLCGFLLWRRRRQLANAAASAAWTAEQAEQRPPSLTDALKEGLFQLETDRLLGMIAEDEYRRAKRTLEGTLEWALTRARDARGTVPELASHSK